MADIKGAYFALDGKRGTKGWYRGGVEADLPAAQAGLFKGAPADYKFYPVPLGPQIHYRMRAWNPVLVDWEIWDSVGAPNTSPPSGDPVTNVTLIRIWET